MTTNSDQNYIKKEIQYIINKLGEDKAKEYINKWNRIEDVVLMQPDLYKYRQMLINEAYVITKKIKISEGVECKYCQSTNTFIQEVQTRAADEATTVYIFCNNCKRKTII
jgi:DNA-directed RNA polymerase subunit M/transcription elongation factor TFIIS